MYASLQSIEGIMLFSNQIIVFISHPSSPSRGLTENGDAYELVLLGLGFGHPYRDSCNVHVMVSLNRQGHIVTRYGKSRNITLRGYSASSPLSCVTNQHHAVDPAAHTRAR